jgi:pullulanase
MRRQTSNLLLIFAILIASFSSAVVPTAQAQSTSPETVNIPGTHQDELGCPGEWMPDCKNTLLTYDAEDDVWQGT